MSAILFALVLFMAGHAVLLFGRTQRWIAATDGRRWVHEEGRRAALALAVADMDTLPPPGTIDAPWSRVMVRSLGPELRLLSADPEPDAPGLGWATLLAAPRPEARVATRSGAARVGGAVFGTWAPSPPPDELCPPGLAALPIPPVGPLPDTLGDPSLGAMGLVDLVGALPALESDRLALSTDGMGGCEEPGGFGDPARPGACPGVWGEGARTGDLLLSGRGQGVLAVSGDLTLAPEARFRGWVWVSGTLRLGSGAELRGLVDVGDRLIVEPGGAFLPDGCSGALALSDTPSLLRPRPVGPGAWPVFRP